MSHVCAAVVLLFLCLACPTFASITLSPSVYNQNGQMISFQWSDITGVQESDIIALVSTGPTAAEIGTRYPLNYIWVRQAAPSTYKQGSGSAQFWVTNMRKDLWVVYLRYPNENVPAPAGTFAWGKQTVLASAKLSPSPWLLSTPNQLHLSIQPTPSRTSFNIQVAWQSTNPGGHAVLSTDPKALHHHVHTMQAAGNAPESEPAGPMGHHPAPYEGNTDDYLYTFDKDSASKDHPYGPEHYHADVLHVEALADSYTISDMCSNIAKGQGWLEPGYTNYALFEGLPPNTRFFYAVRSKQGPYSQVKSFLTPPLAAPDCLHAEYAWKPYGRLAAAANSTVATLLHRDPSRKSLRERNNEDDPPSKHHEQHHEQRYSHKQPHHEHHPRKEYPPHVEYPPQHIGDACMEDVAPLRMLLAADHGKHNMGDGSWWADGLGFYQFGQFSSAPGNVFGPLWPGKEYRFPGTPASDPSFPIGNFLYSAIYLNRGPAWGFQPASKYVTDALTKEAASGRYHAGFIAGDLSYSSGMVAQWDRWLTQLEGMLSVVPTNYASGNHECADPHLPENAITQASPPDAGGECGIPYDRRLRMPFADGINPASRPEYYYYTIGPIAIISINTDQKWEVNSTQYNWLVNTLEKLAAERRQGRLPFLVVALHRPMYTDDPDYSVIEGVPAGDASIALAIRAALEPLFAKYEVDMTWSGHVHRYHRSVPVLKGQPADPPGDVRAPVHVTFGNAGYQVTATAFNTTPEWMAKESWDFGYCTLEAIQTLHKSSLCMRCFNAVSGAQVDEITLNKNADWRPNQSAAEAYYQSLTPAPLLPGIELSAKVLPYLTYLLTDGFLALVQSQYPYMVANFGPFSQIGTLLNATPGSRLFGLSDLLELYRVAAQLGLNVKSSLPPPGQPLGEAAAPSLQYILQITSPGGRLYQAVYGQ